MVRNVVACPPTSPPMATVPLATFGVYAPETKRIIHMREVFR